jgi:hypothetical protein
MTRPPHSISSALPDDAPICGWAGRSSPPGNTRPSNTRPTRKNAGTNRSPTDWQPIGDLTPPTCPVCANWGDCLGLVGLGRGAEAPNRHSIPPPPEKNPVLRSIKCLSPLGGSPASRRGPVPNPVYPAFPAGTCGIISLFRWPRRRFLPLYRWTVAALFPTPERDLHAHGLRSAA